VTVVAAAARGEGEIAAAVAMRALRLADGARLIAASVARRSRGRDFLCEEHAAAAGRQRVRVWWRIASRFARAGGMLQMHSPAVPLASEVAGGWIGDSALASPTEFWMEHALATAAAAAAACGNSNTSSDVEQDGVGGNGDVSQFRKAAGLLLRWGPDIVVAVGHLGEVEAAALVDLVPQGSTPLLVSSLGPHPAGWATYASIVNTTANGGAWTEEVGEAVAANTEVAGKHRDGGEVRGDEDGEGVFARLLAGLWIAGAKVGWRRVHERGAQSAPKASPAYKVTPPTSTSLLNSKE